ncbi:MAG TPA: phosphatidate cytidylyltransferase [Candidatus Atribacteria bacterium]|nr:phosphatidate cytidylyltransferase [Candidatus Atribacteria bacterium]
MAEEYNNLAKRILVIIISVPLVILIILWGQIPFFVLLTVLVSLSLNELFKMLQKIGFEPSIALGFVLSFYFIGSTIANFYNLKILYDKEIIVIFIFILYLFIQLFKKDHSKLLSNISISIFSGIYLGYLSSFLLKIIFLPNGDYFLLSLLFTIWINDSAAYLFGTKFGKNKIFPKISPKKSLEGSISGILFSILCVFMLKNCLNLNFTKLIFLGLIISTIAQLGDLFESIIKRCSGVKDSSNIIPGHGGILDCIDSILFTAPVFYYYIIYLR